MTDLDELKEQLTQLNKPFRKSNYPTLYQQVVDITNFLPVLAKIKERLYCIKYDIISPSVCKHCDINPVKFLGSSTGYREYCSVTCSSNSISKQETIRQTNIKNFGTKTPAESNLGKQRIIQTLESKYGVGVRSTQQVSSVRAKTISTNLEKFGSESYTGSKRGKQAITSSHIEKYGKVRFTQTPVYKPLFIKTNRIKYNRNHHNQAHIELDNLTKANDPNWLNNQHTILQKPQSQIAQELGVGASLIGRKFREFDIEPLSFFQSTGESELTQFILNRYNGIIHKRTKKIIYPYELDIYLPDLNLAIEYNGIYWHSENNNKDRNYHLNKHKLCKNKGIRLIQIYDIEWQ